MNIFEENINFIIHQSIQNFCSYSVFYIKVLPLTPAQSPRRSSEAMFYVAIDSVSDLTSLTSIQTNFFKIPFLNSRCWKVFVFTISALPFTNFRAYLRSVKKNYSGLGNFLIFGQNIFQMNNYCMQKKNISVCSSNYLLLAWFSCEEINDFIFFFH